jgi:hypothetical protein
MYEQEPPLALIIFAIGLFVFLMASLWSVFEKAGKPGWAAIVPIYNLLVLLDLTGRPRWWFFMFIIPIANLVFLIMMYNSLSRSFGKDEGFTVGLVLLNIVFIPILAFGDATYIGPDGVPQQPDTEGRPLDSVF